MTDERIQEIRELWRADLKAMDEGAYVPPLPSPILATSWPDAPAPKRVK